MKHLTVCALLLLAACAGSAPPVTAPDVRLVQVYGPSDLTYARGQDSVFAEYAVQVANRAEVPITLTHVSLQTVGGSTIYLRREERSYKIEIAPGNVGEARLQARVYFTTDVSGSPSREPLTLRAILTFDSPKGKFNRIVQGNIGQFPQ